MLPSEVRGGVYLLRKSGCENINPLFPKPLHSGDLAYATPCSNTSRSTPIFNTRVQHMRAASDTRAPDKHQHQHRYPSLALNSFRTRVPTSASDRRPTLAFGTSSRPASTRVRHSLPTGQHSRSAPASASGIRAQLQNTHSGIRQSRVQHTRSGIRQTSGTSVQQHSSTGTRVLYIYLTITFVRNTRHLLKRKDLLEFQELPRTCAKIQNFANFCKISNYKKFEIFTIRIKPISNYKDFHFKPTINKSSPPGIKVTFYVQAHRITPSSHFTFVLNYVHSGFNENMSGDRESKDDYN
ncbi:hypothetical protein ZOSMA_324G00280 [Zostera marina]|uniref:Uncharacterized protein n=1 Tax=Zostera marina TaxID=29655 RepID=A0A0K9P8R5_ZOSMR|nr:hypothetical protein ZOSMA_324G00280 [Zostera marina]